MYCDICNQPMKLNIWHEEYWGSKVRVEEYDCENPNCGEEEEEDE